MRADQPHAASVACYHVLKFSDSCDAVSVLSRFDRDPVFPRQTVRRPAVERRCDPEPRRGQQLRRDRHRRRRRLGAPKTNSLFDSIIGTASSPATPPPSSRRATRVHPRNRRASSTAASGAPPTRASGTAGSRPPAVTSATLGQSSASRTSRGTAAHAAKESRCRCRRDHGSPTALSGVTRLCAVSDRLHLGGNGEAIGL